MAGLEARIERKGLELGFSNVGFAAVRDYPEYLEQARARAHYGIFAGGNDALLARFLEGLGMRVERSQFCMPQRLVCAEAGIVTYGNNNFVYTQQDGSFVILVTFLVDRELEPTGSNARNGCPEGCSLCRDACPTRAMSGPCELDLDCCILFNNQRFEPGAQEEIWSMMGLRIHGCDACQEVCPRNRRVLAAASAKDPFLEALAEEFSLEKVLLMDDAYYEKVVRPIMYNYITDLDIFRRNAAVALGNTGDATHLPALRSAQERAGSPHVLKAISWAIGRLEERRNIGGRCEGHA